jgi:signal transduction histidine kinase
MADGGDAAGSARPRWRPRLRTVLLTVNLLILLLPLGGIAILRLYENGLIRRTESQLIAQGALVRESFREIYLETAAAGAAVSTVTRGPVAGRPLPDGWRPTVEMHGELTPIPPRLDISRDRVLPPAPEARPVSGGGDPFALEAGARLSEVLEATSRVTLAGIRIVDSAGIVVASSGTERGLSLAHREEVAAALEGREVSLLRRRLSDREPPPLKSISRGQRYRVFVALPVIEEERLLGAVVLSRTPLDIAKALYLNRRPLLIGAGALLGVVVLVSVLTSLTISRPVRALIRQADRVTRGEKEAVVALSAPGTLELARLSEALAGMARTLGERADYIRTFATHVSHEFKTPLTTIRGTVELLEERFDEMSPDERARFLHNLGQASRRLERLVGRLLQQARADVARPGDETTGVVAAIEASLRDQHDSGLGVSVQQAGEVGSVRMAKETLQEILSNLLDNARQHGGEGTRVCISARRDRTATPPMVELRIADDGKGISPANVSRVFTPFFTTARDRGGSGLGLSIVRSLLAAHGGSIELERTARGACFLLRLPAA